MATETVTVAKMKVTVMTHALFSQVSCMLLVIVLHLGTIQTVHVPIITFSAPVVDAFPTQFSVTHTGTVQMAPMRMISAAHL